MGHGNFKSEMTNEMVVALLCEYISHSESRKQIRLK